MTLEQYLARLPTKAPARVAEDITAAYRIATAFSAKAASVKADAGLSAIGKAAALEKVLKGGPLDHLKQLRAHAAGEIMGLQAQRRVLRERALKDDSFDAALLGETRSYLRGLSHADRLKMIKGDDPLIKAAVITAPAFLSGLPDDLWNHISDAVTQERFGEALAEIDVLERSYQEAHSAISLQTDNVRRESGLAPDEFARFAA
jgi:hypothetical protein